MDLPSHGVVGTCTAALASGGECQMLCNAGYRLQQSLFADVIATTCTLGVLRVPTCVACEEGQFKPGPSDMATECQLCPAGYTSSAASSSCSIGQPCTEGRSLPESDAVCTGGTGSECIFECNPGYAVTGRHTCTADHEFVGGSCIAQQCAEGITIENSSVECIGYTGDRCSFQCDLWQILGTGDSLLLPRSQIPE